MLLNLCTGHLAVWSCGVQEMSSRVAATRLEGMDTYRTAATSLSGNVGTTEHSPSEMIQAEALATLSEADSVVVSREEIAGESWARHVCYMQPIFQAICLVFLGFGTIFSRTIHF